VTRTEPAAALLVVVEEDELLESPPDEHAAISVSTVATVHAAIDLGCIAVLPSALCAPPCANERLSLGQDSGTSLDAEAASLEIRPLPNLPD
jgi:hypothetical protein